MATIQAIETVYRGHRFRSRLEARWAVFFDHLDIEWRYEPQGYEIAIYDETRRYLPDFYLPGLDVWVEVKGDESRIDWTLLGVACDGFAAAGLPPSRHAYGGSGNGSAVLILGDVPPDDDIAWMHPMVVNQKGVYCEWMTFGRRRAQGWTGIDEAGEVSPGYFDATWGGFDGEWDWETRPSIHGKGAVRLNLVSGQRQHLPRPAPVRAAYTAARCARFEHGEAGR